VKRPWLFPPFTVRDEFAPHGKPRADLSGGVRAAGTIWFFSFSIYTRILSPEEYALYSVGTSVSFLISNVAYGWIRFSVGRYQADSPATNFLPFVLVCYLVVTALLIPVIGVSAALVQSLSIYAILAVSALTMGQVPL